MKRKSGFYWYKNDGSWTIVEVEGDGSVYFLGNDEVVHVDQLTGEWGLEVTRKDI